MRKRTEGELRLSTDLDKQEITPELTHVLHTLALLVNYIIDHTQPGWSREMMVGALQRAGLWANRAFRRPRGFEDND